MERRDFVKHGAVAGVALSLRPRWALGAGTAPGAAPGAGGAQAAAVDFSPGWRFHLGDVTGADRPGFDDGAWEAATLPHTARVESLVTGAPGTDSYQWQGTCWYRKSFTLDEDVAGRTVILKFEAAMNVADVWLNGRHLGRHMGGWLPFAFDVYGDVVPGGENVVSVRLDNRDDPVTGPKPLADLDFNPYHGIYRNVHLVIKDSLHITDPILAGKAAGGGVFVTYPRVTANAATVRVQTHVRNAGPGRRAFQVRVRLLDGEGRVAAEDVSARVDLAPGEDGEVRQDVSVASPALWSPRDPALYTLRTEVVEEGATVDEEVTRIGIRHISMTPDGFRINGERLFLRGTNRHQEYPYVGYALSDDAQYRDARKIKDAGFDYVRLSHYAHAPAFMDACDELGLVVMDCIPGWQYFDRENPAFAELQLDNCRALIRRDRNHPCVILWEVSLNESWMTDDFIARSHAIAHEEYPGDQCYSCGWTQGYDVFIQARQHGGCTEVTDQACLVSEYGDWEYYAQNAGLEQQAWADLAPDAANSRQLRWHGEAALLQQATNFQEGHNDNLKTIAFADGLWVMFDYNRGYAPDIESSGCMDIFRLPKLSYPFFRSQRGPAEELAHAASGPMVFIASYWTPDSATDVRVFSNCEEVALHLDGTLVERRGPDADRLSTELAHPPFTFRVGAFRPGTLEAVGYVGGREAARHSVRTPGSPRRLELRLDEDGRPFGARGKDVAFVRADLRDADGTLVPDAWENVSFGATGDVKLTGANPFSSDAGIASILLEAEAARPRGAVYALCLIREGGRVRALSAGRSVGGALEPHEVRVTTDGREAGADAPVYTGPVDAGRVRATLFVGGRRVAEADTDAPKFRVAGSTAPEPAPE